MAAYEKLLEWGEKKIPVGVLYQAGEPTYEGQIPQIAKKSLVGQGPKKWEIKDLMKKYQ